MASLHKDPRGKSPYWYCAYTLPSGKRVFKSTKQTDRQKAEEFRIAISRATRLGAERNLTEQRARELIGETVENASGETLTSYTVSAWFEEWLAGKRGAKANSTVEKYRRTATAFLQFLGPKAAKNLGHVSMRDVRGFRDFEAEQGKHPNTCNWLLKHLRMGFTAARRQGLIAHNPADAVELLRAPSESQKSVFELEQVRALLHAAEDEWRGVILAGFYTGARLRDIAQLRWRSVDVEEGVLSVSPSKTRKPMIIPLHPELQRDLSARRTSEGPDDYVFPRLAAKTVGGNSGLSMSFARIMQKAGIEPRIVREGRGSGRTVHSLSFHALRHSFNSLMANAGVSQEIRQRLTGHASPAMNRRYTHHEIGPLRQAVAALPHLGPKALPSGNQRREPS